MCLRRQPSWWVCLVRHEPDSAASVAGNQPRASDPPSGSAQSQKPACPTRRTDGGAGPDTVRLVAWLPAEASAPEVSEQREHNEYDHDDPDQVHHSLSLTIGSGERSSRATPDSLGAARLSSWDMARMRQVLFPVSEVLAVSKLGRNACPRHLVIAPRPTLLLTRSQTLERRVLNRRDYLTAYQDPPY